MRPKVPMVRVVEFVPTIPSQQDGSFKDCCVCYFHHTPALELKSERSRKAPRLVREFVSTSR